MANQYKNKVIYNGTTLIDLSDTTAVQSDVASGKYFYTASGEKVEGTNSGSGGESIENGIVFTGFDSSGRPTSADIYGDVPPNMFGHYQTGGVGTSLNSVLFKGVTQKIGAGAFQRTALTSITIPDSVDSIGVQIFRLSTALAHYVHENARDLYGYGKPAVKALQYALAHLEDMQLGAVGKPVTDMYKDTFLNSQAPNTAVVTIYTTGDRVDAFLTAMRTKLTTQQIVFKAAEATTYDGTSYAAGATIVTSTP